MTCTSYHLNKLSDSRIHTDFSVAHAYFVMFEHILPANGKSRKETVYLNDVQLWEFHRKFFALNRFYSGNSEKSLKIIRICKLSISQNLVTRERN